jgi:hypothetical protein
MQIGRLLSSLNIRSCRVYLSLLLGVIFGFSVYAYWLIDIFPPASRRILLFTVFAGAMGTVGYYFLLELWLVPRFSQLTGAAKWKAAAWGIGIGLFLMFAGTSAWMSPSRYLIFLLPEESLEISVSSSSDANTSATTVLWITTSLGDVSYDTIDYLGWRRKENQLVLDDRLNNSFNWTGRAGEKVSILFRKSPQSGKINISWNGERETIDLFSDSVGDYLYHHEFQIPFYASQPMALWLVSINFILAGCSLDLLARKEKARVAELFNKSIQAHLLLTRKPGLDTSKPIIDSIIVVFFILLALLLRVFNLENLYPYADEYHHLLAVKALLAGASWDTVYQRGFFIVTLPVVFSFELFGVELWAARLPGVLFNALAVIPLFLITKKINRRMAVLSCLLYATSPYIIAFARDVREYAYYPFYFYWIIYAMVLFLQGFPDGFVLARDWKRLRSTIILMSIILVLPIVYSEAIDGDSTFRLILVAYGVFAVFLLRKFDLRNVGNLVVLGIAAIGTGIIASTYLARFMTFQFFDSRPLLFFFVNPEQQWYFSRVAVLPLIGFFYGFFLTTTFWRSNFVPSFLYTLYIVYLLFFVMFFGATGFNLHPRFLVSAQLWYIPTITIGLFCIWICLRVLFNEKRFVIFTLTLFLFFATFNFPQILLPTLSREEYMPISRLIHDDFDEAQSYLLEQSREGDVLVGGVYARYASWQETPKFSAIYTYSDPDIKRSGMEPREYIASIVGKYDSGWIVLDDLRFKLTGSPLPQGLVLLQEKKVEYVGKFISQYVWRWGVK